MFRRNRRSVLFIMELVAAVEGGEIKPTQAAVESTMYTYRCAVVLMHNRLVCS